MKHVLYHSNCYDGIMAAASAYDVFRDAAQYHPMYYNGALPAMENGDEVFCVDYSVNKDTLECLFERGIHVTILDHHMSAARDLEGFDHPLLTKRFDMSRSGAMITWQYLHAIDVPVPDVLYRVEDRDLGRTFKGEAHFSDSMTVHAGLCSIPMTVDLFYNVLMNVPLSAVVERGEVILGYHETLVDNLKQQARIVTIGGENVPIVGLCVLFSEVPHALLADYPDSPFAAYAYYRKDCVQFGLRGRDTDDVDVSLVAKQYGGGGHKKSAGFELDFGQAQSILSPGK